MACYLGLLALNALFFITTTFGAPAQNPLIHNTSGNSSAIPVELFVELEELARVVDISYCVGTAGLGIQKPFDCASRCGEFENFELITTWNTGPLLSDSCGYIALSHPPSPPRIILAFRGTYSIANTIVDLSTIPQKYVPYPGDDDEDTVPSDFISPLEPRDDVPPDPKPPKCENCTVHMGFYASWLNTRKAILSDVTEAVNKYPGYKLTLVGHSLGGAVAALAGLDFTARGWAPRVTTFGEPRVGNSNFNAYINNRFNVTSGTTSREFHRVTHVDDPIPLLPLAEWGYGMHSEEVFISAPDLPPSVTDLRRCEGDEDPKCIAGNDGDSPSWGIPTRFKFWQLFFAHRDYFWRLGLCVPGDPKDWYQDDPKLSSEDEEILGRMEL